MNRIKQLTGWVALMTPAAAVEAHAGLVEGNSLIDGLTHFVTSLDHLLLLLLAGGVVSLVRRKSDPQKIDK